MPFFNSENQLPFFDSVIDELQANNNNNNNIFYQIESQSPTQPTQTQQIQSDSTVPCFLKGTKILTTKGEINIEDLKITDKLINCLGNKCNIVKINCFKREKNENTHPYIIYKNTKINNFICNKDLYLSKDHAVLINNEYFIVAKDLPFAKQITDLECNNYEYYHITTENYFTDTIISNGIPTESFCHKLPKNIIPYIYKNKVRRLLKPKNKSNTNKLKIMNFI